MSLSRAFYHAFSFLAVAFLPFSLAAAQPADQPQRLHQIVDAYHQLGLFNGNALVMRGENVLLERSYGFADVTRRRHNTMDTKFNIYSITKPFTATVVLQLVAEELLQIDEPIARFYPTLPGADRITIRHLLGHTSGLYAYNNDFDMPVVSERAMLQWLEKRPPDSEPGSRFRYNNTGYFLLGYIIEKVTGLRYEDAVRERILTPLNMRETGFDLRGVNDREKAVGYTHIQAAAAEEAPIWDYKELYSAGGMYATAKDLSLFPRSLENGRLLPHPLAELARTPSQKSYGLGWYVDSTPQGLIISHSGGATGFRSYLVRDLANDICIVLLGNSETSEIVTIKDKLLDELNGRTYRLPQPIPGLATRLHAYEGAFQLTPSMTVYIHREKGQLMATPNRQGSSILLPMGSDHFLIESMGAELRFIPTPAGAYDSFLFSHKGESATAKRLPGHWGITGSATPQGWEGPDIALNQQGHLWVGTGIALTDGLIKFRYNNDWVLNYGVDESTGRPKKGAGDLPVDAGIYTVTLDLTNPDKAEWKLEKVKPGAEPKGGNN